MGVVLLAGCDGGAGGGASFPDRPVTVVVYTGPGGMLDITARKFCDIASRYTDATFVVENRPGAGGVVAVQSVIEAPADGYTLFAATKSLIAKLVASDSDVLVDALEWNAMMLADPECVIVNRESEITDWAELIRDAQRRDNQQIWVGPAAGGLDHITAMKIWEKAGMMARWVPYKSGGRATTALMGKQGAAYVGNLADLNGKPSLKAAALCAASRSGAAPDVPTFKELGIEGLEHEYMWRGFAVRKGIPDAARQWYAELFTRVAADEEWRAIWEKSGMDVFYRGPEAFTEIVQEDRQVFSLYLRKLGVLKDADQTALGAWGARWGRVLPLFALFMAFAGALLLSRIRHSSLRLDSALVPLLLMSTSLLFLLMSATFPAGEGVGPAVPPRLWSGFLLAFSAVLIVRDVSVDRGDRMQTGRAWLFLSAAGVYIMCVMLIGYLISSLVFLSIAPLLLERSRLQISILLAVGWVVLAWIIFERTMQIPLPSGSLL